MRIKLFDKPMGNVALRLPVEVLETIERKAGKQNIKACEWLRKRIIYDTMRPHKRRVK